MLIFFLFSQLSVKLGCYLRRSWKIEERGESGNREFGGWKNKKQTKHLI